MAVNGEPPSFLETLTEHLEAIAERDLDRFAATLAHDDDVRFAGGDGTMLEGRENVVAAHREWFMDDRWTFEPEMLWTREEEGAAWALTRVTYAEERSKRQFLLLFLLVREEGDWKVLYDQNTPIATSE